MYEMRGWEDLQRQPNIHGLHVFGQWTVYQCVITGGWWAAQRRLSSHNHYDSLSFNFSLALAFSTVSTWRNIVKKTTAIHLRHLTLSFNREKGLPSPSIYDHLLSYERFTLMSHVGHFIPRRRQ